MRVALLGMGSRGDVEPFVALAPRLAALGHDPVVVAAPDLADLVEGQGLAFEPLSVQLRAGVESDLGRRWLRGSSTNQVREAALMRRVVAFTADAVAADLERVVRSSDAVVSSALTFEAATSLCDRLGRPHVTAQFQPVWPSRHGPSSSFALRPGSCSVLNLGWSWLAAHAAWSILRQTGDRLRRRGVLPRKGFRGHVADVRRVPAILAASPSVVPPAPDWPDTVTQTGWWFTRLPPAWQPPEELARFLGAGDPPVHLGFGSMPTHDPDAVLRAFLQALRRTGRRGIVSAGWAGIGRDAGPLPDDVLLVDTAPHEWLFPRCAAVVHHGGAGTTAAAFRAGVPQVVVPHIADQPYWGRRVHALGCGPSPVPRSALGAASLTRALEEALSPATARPARDLGVVVAAEDGAGEAARAVADVLAGTSATDA